MNATEIVNKIKTAPTWMKLTTVGLLSFGLYEGFNHKEDILSPPKVASAQDLSSKKDGEEVMLTFVVAGSHKTYDGKILLNSNKDFNASDNITAVCSTTHVPDHQSIVGKTVTVRGTKSKYKSKKTGKESDQIQVSKIEVKS